MKKKYTVIIEVKSPLHLGAGEGDVNSDAEVVHEACGLPYFPAKRFRGLLYESALEVAEMAERCGAHFLKKELVNRLFGRTEGGDMTLVISNFYLFLKENQSDDGWEKLKADLERVERCFGDVTAQDVLEEYTSLRVQTSIDKETGTTKDGSLRNMRCVNRGISFTGTVDIEARDGEMKSCCQALALALQNLTAAGGKRNRGFGQVKCHLEKEAEQAKLVKEALKNHG